MSTDTIIADSSKPTSPARSRYLSETDRVRSRESGEWGVTLRAFAVDLVQLTKPRIVTMILVTTVASASIGTGGVFPIGDLILLLIGTGLVAASAGAANQVWERQIDERMPRTAVRPLPDQRMKVSTAVMYTAVLGVSGTSLLFFRFGLEPAFAGGFTWFLYVLVYTPMKTRTAWNTSVGAIAGAVPVLIGYTAAGGGLGDATGWLLVVIVAAWQYPHFMAIAWLYRRQYAEAGFRMTTTVDPSGKSAGWQSIAGSLVIVTCALALCELPTGAFAGFLAAFAIVVACYPMLRASLQFARLPDDVMARRLLRSSLLVLPAVLLILTLRALS